MARKRGLQTLADAVNHTASASSETELANTNMHTAVEAIDDIEFGLIPVNFVDNEAPPSNESINLLSQALRNASTNMEGTTHMTTTEMGANGIDYSDPNPRKNSIVQNVHVSNTQMRLESENAILRATVNEIDRKIAELQAERTDATGAIAMNNAALNAGEKL